MTFPRFVAIRLNGIPKASIDYKAMASFSKAIRHHWNLPVEDMLRVWIAAMIDKGFTQPSRKRYVEKLGTIYKEYCVGQDIDGNPFEAIRDLRDCPISMFGKDISVQCDRLSEIFNTVLNDAKTRPELALFLYLLFNASSDIESAISLRTEKYVPVFAQLNDIIDPSTFHHRRKFIFDLNQSRKRMPQLVREVFKNITAYLSVKGVRFDSPFTSMTIVALWTAKAREVGIGLSDLKSVLAAVPSEYEYLKYVKGLDLSDETKLHIKKTVAEAFSPTAHRWYAMKLRRGASFEGTKEYLTASLPEVANKILFFYPMREVTKKVDKKLVRESVPYIPDVVFMKTGTTYIADIDKHIRRENLGWMFRQTNAPGSDYSIIDWHAMRAFQMAVGEFTPDTKIELTSYKPIGIGRKVRITGGVLAGYMGDIYDIKRDGQKDSRQIYIRLSCDYGIRVELKIDEFFVEVIDNASCTA